VGLQGVHPKYKLIPLSAGEGQLDHRTIRSWSSWRQYIGQLNCCQYTGQRPYLRPGQKERADWIPQLQSGSHA